MALIFFLPPYSHAIVSASRVCPLGGLKRNQATYLIVEILCPPFRNQVLLQLSVVDESATRIPKYRGGVEERTDFANFILSS
jgi:hypothetical protein